MSAPGLAEDDLILRPLKRFVPRAAERDGSTAEVRRAGRVRVSEFRELPSDEHRMQFAEIVNVL